MAAGPFTRFLETFDADSQRRGDQWEAVRQRSRWNSRRMRKYSKTVWMPGGSMGHLAVAIEVTWIVPVLESSVPTTVTFFPANSLDLSWSLN